MRGIVNSSRRGNKIIRFLVSFLFILTICCPLRAQENPAQNTTVPAESTPEGLIGKEIEQAIEESVFKTGAFRIRPDLQVLGGYDSNAFSSAQNPVEDEFFKVIPAIRTFVILQDRAVINVDEALNIVYYRSEPDLNDIFNSTSPAIPLRRSPC